MPCVLVEKIRAEIAGHIHHLEANLIKSLSPMKLDNNWILDSSKVGLKEKPAFQQTFLIKIMNIY